MKREELVRLASDPTENNTIIVDDISSPTEAIRERVASALCNSKLHFSSAFEAHSRNPFCASFKSKFHHNEMTGLEADLSAMRQTILT